MRIGDFFRSLKAELLGISLDKSDLENNQVNCSDQSVQPRSDLRYHPDGSRLS